MRLLTGCVWMAAAGCDAGDAADDAPIDDGDADTDADTDSDSDTDVDTDDTDTGPPVDEFGLDVRPANPTCLAPPRPPDGSTARLVDAFPALEFTEAMMLLMAPGDDTKWWVPTQVGIIYRFPDDDGVTPPEVEVMLDLTDRVDAGGNEMGLLGMAFHPDFATNGELYVYYSADKNGAGIDHESRTSRFVFDHLTQTFDPAAESFVIRIDQPFSNHNGGTIAFGSDGYLYQGMGDGGSAGDPGDRAQDPTELLGKMLRIDVDGADPYEIPPDNPFSGGGGEPEIYAMGLRNPFRFAFDPDTGDLWLGDVGQGEWEEINLVELGGNYGWNVREGFECYQAVMCASAGLIPPVAVYPSNGASVIAGQVYHGTAITGLQGVLLYNDFYNGAIVGLFYDPLTGFPAPANVVGNPGRNIVHYGAHSLTREIYVVDHGYPGGFAKLEPPVVPEVDTFPNTLSATGCFDATDPNLPLESMIPYDVAHPFWSDGATKNRWFAIPDPTTIDVADGDWVLPIGTVIAKEFSEGGAKLETRLFMRHDDGGWAGYAYAWRDDGTDADLLYGGLTLDDGVDTWSIPDRAECLRCHTEVAGYTLGFETWQLNSLADYPSTGRTANQLATLDHIGMFTVPIGDPATYETLPAIDDTTASAEDRARAYLHVNCSICHRPDGPSRGDTDFRYTTALADTGLCDAPIHGTLGLVDPLVITPGDPGASVLVERMEVRDAYQMPPLGTLEPDDVAVGVFHAWVGGMVSCP